MVDIILLGSRGQLGWELERTLSPLGRVCAFDYPQIDLRQTDNLRKIIIENKPNVIVNASAYTNVDLAEQETEAALDINGRAPAILAELSKELDAVLLHYSTDYVFDGSKSASYIESDIPNPINVYGQSKLIGDQGIVQINPVFLILRTSWVYSLRRECFVTKVMKMARQRVALRIVTDQIGSPTWARMLAETTALILAKASTNHDFFGWLKEREGLYHLAGAGWTSRYEWAEVILNFFRQKTGAFTPKLIPAKTVDFPSPAKRPLFSALDCTHFEEVFDLRLPDWKDSLRLATDSEIF